MVEITDKINQLCYRIIGICMEVHNTIGPGFPERYYQKALEIEFMVQKITFEAQKELPMLYKGHKIATNYLDFLIENELILEIKSVNMLDNIHLWQVMKYIQVSGLNVALLVNFGLAKLEYKRVLPTLKIQEARKK